MKKVPYKSRFNKKDKFLPPSDWREKDDDFYMDMAKYIWSFYCRDEGLNLCGGGLRNGMDIYELRAYSRNAQSVSRYQDLIDLKDGKDGSYAMNINWQPVDIMGKYKAILKSKLNRFAYEFDTVALDVESNNEKELLVNSMKLKASDSMKALAVEMGINVPIGNGIETPEDVEMLNMMGGISLEWEIAMKIAVEYFEQISSFDEIRHQIERDIIDLNQCFLYIYLDSSDRINAKYVDPEKYVGRDSKYEDLRDIDCQGYWEYKTAREIREESGVSAVSYTHLTLPTKRIV